MLRNRDWPPPDSLWGGSDSGAELEQEQGSVAVPPQESDWVLEWQVPEVTRPWPLPGSSLQDRGRY